jgi:ABC-type multidrug transport system fused ATPase/permease subunit
MFFYGINIKKLTKKMQDNKATMSSGAEEAFSNIRTVKAFANEIEETQKFNRNNMSIFEVAKIRCAWQGCFVFVIQVLCYGSISLIILSAS